MISPYTADEEGLKDNMTSEAESSMTEGKIIIDAIKLIIEWHTWIFFRNFCPAQNFLISKRGGTRLS